MNLSFTRGDKEEYIVEITNESREQWELIMIVWCFLIRHILQILKSFQRSREGITRERSYTDIDGFITNDQR